MPTPEAVAREVRASANRPWVFELARVGHAAKGLVFGLIGLLAIQSALGVRTSPRDPTGALTTIFHAPLGRVLVPLLGAGLASYAAWRFIEALFDPDGHDTKLKSALHRVVSAGAGVAYTVMAFTTFKLLLGRPVHTQDHAAKTWSAKLMALPMGRLLVAAIGIGLLVAAGAGIYKGWKKSFCKKLDLSRLDPEGRKWAIQVSRVGLIARGIFFGVTGAFFVLAAKNYDPGEAKGLDGAFAALAGMTWGFGLVLALGAGLWAYAAHMLVMARFQRHPSAASRR